MFKSKDLKEDSVESLQRKVEELTRQVAHEYLVNGEKLIIAGKREGFSYQEALIESHGNMSMSDAYERVFELKKQGYKIVLVYDHVHRSDDFIDRLY